MKPSFWLYLGGVLLLAACSAAPGGAHPKPSATPNVTLAATPGGPTGWTVRYTATATGFTRPVRYAFSSCGDFDERAGRQVVGNTLLCHHFKPGERTVTVTATDAAGNEATGRVTQTIEAAEVPYRGTWRWTLREQGEVRSGRFTISEADVMSKGSTPFDEFASRGRALECTQLGCEGMGEAAIFFSQTGLERPAYAFNLQLGTVSPEGDATFGLTERGQQRFQDGGLEVVKLSGEVQGEWD